MGVAGCGCRARSPSPAPRATAPCGCVAACGPAATAWWPPWPGPPRAARLSPCAADRLPPMSDPYGSWRSALSTDVLVAGELRLGAGAFAGDALIWQERRPAEGGRSVLVRDGVDLTPEGFDVRSRVHEYGGGAWAAFGGGVVFSNDADGRLYRQ